MRGASRATVRAARPAASPATATAVAGRARAPWLRIVPHGAHWLRRRPWIPQHLKLVRGQSGNFSDRARTRARKTGAVIWPRTAARRRPAPPGLRRVGRMLGGKLRKQILGQRCCAVDRPLQRGLAVPAHEIVGVVAVGQEQETRLLSVRQHRQRVLEGPPGGLAPGVVAVEAEDDEVGQPKQFLRVNGRGGRSECRYRVLDAGAGRRGLHGRRGARAARHRVRGCHARHVDHARARAEALPADRPRRVLLRRRHRRAQGRLARAREHAAGAGRRQGGAFPVPARRRGPRRFRARARQGRVRGRARRRDTAVRVPAGRACGPASADTAEGRAALVAAARPYVDQIAAPVLGALVRAQLAELAGLPEAQLGMLLGSTARDRAPRPARPEPRRADPPGGRRRCCGRCCRGCCSSRRSRGATSCRGPRSGSGGRLERVLEYCRRRAGDRRPRAWSSTSPDRPYGVLAELLASAADQELRPSRWRRRSSPPPSGGATPKTTRVAALLRQPLESLSAEERDTLTRRSERHRARRASRAMSVAKGAASPQTNGGDEAPLSRYNLRFFAPPPLS